ncbi:MAG: GAF domain-containing SpoIIE family protein phosphatase [Planctomycetota bacterium]|nr:GAF domain-containing SpoIIE family protein phosphatase [Planctomycetota bacterium]
MARVPSLTHFLTDASVVRLCTVLGQIGRAKVTVHDRSGQRVVYTGSDPPWALGPLDDDAHLVAHAMTTMERSAGVIPHDGRMIEPVMVAGEIIGAIVIEADALRAAAANIDKVRDVVARLAATISEFCEQDVLLRQRNAELSVLFRLSSMLVSARDVDTVLSVALRSAVQILSADAGCVHLLEDDGRQPLRAHLNLSGQFIKAVTAAPPESAPMRELMAAEGLEGLVTGSLYFSGRSLGQLRLFWRRSVFMEPPEQALLQTIMEQVSAAVASARLIVNESRARQVQRQLKLAADVQRRMLPRTIPNHPRLDIDARYIPSMELGGDFYDLIDLSGHLGLLIGDVAGKGVPAALLMASVRSSFRAYAHDLYHLSEVMARVNRALARDTLANEFTTIFYGVIDPASLRLTYCNAGHDPPLLLRAKPGRPPVDADFHELEAGGMVVGVDASQTYASGMFDLQKGDTIIAYTDGIVDARNFENERFGRTRLRAGILSFLARTPDATAKALADHLVWEVRRFIGLNPQVDDETLVILRVRG